MAFRARAKKQAGARLAHVRLAGRRARTDVGACGVVSGARARTHGRNVLLFQCSSSAKSLSGRNLALYSFCRSGSFPCPSGHRPALLQDACPHACMHTWLLSSFRPCCALDANDAHRRETREIPQWVRSGPRRRRSRLRFFLPERGRGGALLGGRPCDALLGRFVWWERLKTGWRGCAVQRGRAGKGERDVQACSYRTSFAGESIVATTLHTERNKEGGACELIGRCARRPWGCGCGVSRRDDCNGGR